MDLVVQGARFFAAREKEEVAEGTGLRLPAHRLRPRYPAALY
jgi:hypothetical protein